MNATLVSLVLRRRRPAEMLTCPTRARAAAGIVGSVHSRLRHRTLPTLTHEDVNADTTSSGNVQVAVADSRPGIGPLPAAVAREHHGRFKVVACVAVWQHGHVDRRSAQVPVVVPFAESLAVVRQATELDVADGVTGRASGYRFARVPGCPPAEVVQVAPSPRVGGLFAAVDRASRHTVQCNELRWTTRIRHR